MNRDSQGRFTFDKSDAERLHDRTQAILRHWPSFSLARAERQAADELELAHMVEDDTDRAMGDDL